MEREKMCQDYFYSLTPAYEDETSRQIGVLQHLQTLLEENATLDDVIQLIKSYQQEFGAQAQLEHVIQSLVSRCLEKQVMQRKGRSSQRSFAPLWTQPVPLSLAEQPREVSFAGAF